MTWELARLALVVLLAAAWLLVIVAALVRCRKCGRWCTSPAECRRFQREGR